MLYRLFVYTDETSEIRKQERHNRDSTDRRKMVVVVSTTETKPFASNDNFNKMNDNISPFGVNSHMYSLASENLDLDRKANLKEKHILGESKLSRSNCERDKIFPQQQQPTRANRSPRRESVDIPTLLCIDGKLVDAATSRVKPKIPRPANAFMLFANEWRRKLAAENPRESNKDISVRLVLL